jgi:hypothetical protein
MNRPAYTFVVKGRHWYFRRFGLQEALPGQPGDPEFAKRYAELVPLADRARAKRLVSQSEKAKRAAAARDRRLAAATRRAGLIYFIGSSSGPVKIGFTTNIQSRLHRLQMNSPRKLRVLAAYPGSRRDELMLHRQCANDRLHGEWFKRTPALVGIIRKATAA